MMLGEGYDSQVFLVDGGIEKRYFSHISIETIRAYHAIHNTLSQRALGFECDYGISSVLNGVSEVCIKVLHLGDDILLSKGRVVTRVPYIEGKQIPNEQNIEEMIFMRFFREFLTSNGMNFKREDSCTFPGVGGNDLQYDLEIDPMNMKLIPKGQEKLDIVVTDLGASINFFVHCFLEKHPEFNVE